MPCSSDQSYAFITRDAAPPNNEWKMWVTTDEGATPWKQMGPNANPLPGAPAGPLVASGPAASPTFYFMLNTGASGSPEVWRLSGPFNTSASLTKVNAGLNFPTTIAVDPVDPDLLYAYDLLGGCANRAG